MNFLRLRVRLLLVTMPGELNHLPMCHDECTDLPTSEPTANPTYDDDAWVLLQRFVKVPVNYHQ